MNLEKLFLNLNNTWNFQRRIDSKTKALPSGTVRGQATISLVSDNFLLYQEEGTFKTKQQNEFKVGQRYAYCLQKGPEIIKCFVDENNKTRLFYALVFSLEADGSLSATGTHLCGMDHYQASYAFPKSEGFSDFSLSYRVKGPTKDYCLITKYLLHCHHL